MKKVNLAKPNLVAVDWFLENEVLHRIEAGRIFLSNIQSFELPGDWSDQCKQTHLCLKTAEDQLGKIIKALRDETE